MPFLLYFNRLDMQIKISAHLLLNNGNECKYACTVLVLDSLPLSKLKKLKQSVVSIICSFTVELVARTIVAYCGTLQSRCDNMQMKISDPLVPVTAHDTQHNHIARYTYMETQKWFALHIFFDIVSLESPMDLCKMIRLCTTIKGQHKTFVNNGSWVCSVSYV